MKKEVKFKSLLSQSLSPERIFILGFAGVILLGTLLWYRFSQDFSIGLAFYQVLYHAISAFNNCGYSLFSDSLVRYQGWTPDPRFFFFPK